MPKQHDLVKKNSGSEVTNEVN